MKGVRKCFGLLCLSFIMVGLSLSVYSDTNALKHDYKGINFIVPLVPNHFKTVNNSKEIDWDYNYNQYYDFRTPYQFSFGTGINTSKDYSNRKVDIPLGVIKQGADIESSYCYYDNYYDILDLSYQSEYNYFQFQVRDSPKIYAYLYDNVTHGFEDGTSGDFGSYCQRNLPYGQSPQLSRFEVSTLPLDKYSIFNDDMKPYWFTTNGFYVHSHAINSDNGITYNHAFSLSDIFNEPIYSLHHMELPLYSNDDYWYTKSNIYQGREVSWRGSFEFDKHTQFLDSNDGVFVVRLWGSTGDSEPVEDTIPCSLRYTSIEFNNTYRLDYECSGTLPRNYVWLYPSLYITMGSSDYLFDTDGDWRFGTQFLVTDNDETPGQAFNEQLQGGYIPGDVSNDFGDSDKDWFASLLDLFNFNVIFPFSGLYTMFSDNPCVDIPIIAGMLHSEQTTYCAWFDSTTRSITTPVLSIASMMIIFGFFVRWLKGSSGSDTITFEGDIQ